jgi:hypothetical protein
MKRCGCCKTQRSSTGRVCSNNRTAADDDDGEDDHQQLLETEHVQTAKWTTFILKMPTLSSY